MFDCGALLPSGVRHQQCCILHQVLWVDLLTKQEFEAGFGSHTPIFSGQTKCVRYYMNFERALGVFKEVLLRDGRGFDAHNIAGKLPARRLPAGGCCSTPQSAQLNASACFFLHSHMHVKHQNLVLTQYARCSCSCPAPCSATQHGGQAQGGRGGGDGGGAVAGDGHGLLGGGARRLRPPARPRPGGHPPHGAPPLEPEPCAHPAAACGLLRRMPLS
jgi:hypothetical protein